MKPECSKKSKENTRNSTNILQVLQPEACGKENLVGGSRTPLKDIKSGLKMRGKREKKILIKDVIENVQGKGKKKKMCNKDIQTTEDVEIDIKDLTSEEEPSENYWKILAERRRVALDEALKENQILNDKVEILQQEKETIYKMYEEAKQALDLLK
ncbi:hypothetical protein L9F63_010825, partial [Diploptera punctata]